MLHFIRLLLLIAIPAIAFPDPSELFLPLPEVPTAEKMLSYDEILNLIEIIEDDELGNRCTPEQIEKVAYFLSLLARNGASQSDPVSQDLLDQDIHELLSEIGAFQFSSNPYSGTYSIVPAVSNGPADVLLCKSWVSRQSHNVKKFVKKHKTAIIIGGAIIVAVGATIFVVAALSAGTTAATAASIAEAGTAIGGIAGSSSKDRPSPHSAPVPLSMSPDPTLEFVETPVPESQTLAQLIEEKTAPAIEALSQEAMLAPYQSGSSTDWSFAEKARDVGSVVAHEILDGIATLGSAAPQLLEEIGQIGEKFIPDSMGGLTNFNGASVYPIANYNDTVYDLHEKIDDIFSTNLADHYTPEAEGYRPEFTIGVIPPPVGIRRILSVEEFKKAEKVLYPYSKQYVSEMQAKSLIEQFEIPTFSRPNGIPDNFRVRISDGGAGILYIHPEHTHTSIRVMPGKPHSPFSYQQKPYVVQMRNGRFLDKFGDEVPSRSPEAHIPLEEFLYKD